ncbi:MAG TPA: hypothetical protein VJB88_08665 [Vicinamibacteria bacterium]|nr:hypothetical protein [Vicinamibacteria bacterium]
MLASLLSQLDRIYDLELEVRIEEFLISREVCQNLAGDCATGSTVVVHQGREDEEIELGVYIGEETLARLNELDLSSGVASEHFPALCIAIEEVSHFAYLMWNANRDKSVTQLELELQAEVDKFVTSALLLARKNRQLVPADLMDRLFGDFVLRDGLDFSRRERYLTASSFARTYCSFLVRRFLRGPRVADLLAELRHFYRLTQRGKIGHIYRTVYAS